MGFSSFMQVKRLKVSVDISIYKQCNVPLAREYLCIKNYTYKFHFKCIAGVDFGPSQNYTVTFPAGSTRQSVEIPIIDNSVREVTRDFQLTLDVPEAAVRVGVIDGCDPFTAERSVQIIDDDDCKLHVSVIISCSVSD